MGRLKELLTNANFDLDEITVSEAEARRLLHQLPQADQERVRQANEQKRPGLQPQ